jgi:hypothetical protein
MGMKEVFTTTSPSDAELIRVELRGAGIDSFLENEFGASTAIGLPTSLIPLVVCVDETLYDEAVRIVGQWGRKRPEPLPRFVVSVCASCAKTLEVPEGDPLPDECPFCGKPPAPPA